MKTAMQELIDELESMPMNITAYLLAAEFKKKYLPKEKQQIIDAVNKTYESTIFQKDGDGYMYCPFDGEQYYNETYTSNAPIE